MSAHDVTRATRKRSTRRRPALADPTEAKQLLALLRPVVEPLRRAIPGSAEVVLHDLAKLPNSIVAIEGSVTHRKVGSPASDSLLRLMAAGAVDNKETYDRRMPGGRELRSTNLVFRDSAGVPACALSINVDVTMWRAIHSLAESMLPHLPSVARAESGESEGYATDVDALAGQLVRQAVAACKVPIEQMQKRHRLAVVDELKQRGFFLIRDSVEFAANALQVTRFTIYNYLNELQAGLTPE